MTTTQATPTKRRPKRSETELREELAAKIKALDQKALLRLKTTLADLAAQAQTLATAHSGKPYANKIATAAQQLGAAAGEIKVEQ